MEKRIKKELKFIGRKAFGALIFVAVAGTSIWALAAFTEPTTTPSNSVQDWAKNIMGSNNSDNAFDSSDVIANSDGSLVERLEYLEVKTRARAISVESGTQMNYANAAAYCRDLSATAETTLDGSSTGTTHTNWRIGSMTELSNFVGTTASANRIWSATPGDAYGNDWMTLTLNIGVRTYESQANSKYVRCIR